MAKYKDPIEWSGAFNEDPEDQQTTTEIMMNYQMKAVRELAEEQQKQDQQRNERKGVREVDPDMLRIGSLIISEDGKHARLGWREA
jgi:hypothetical protein